MKQKMKIKPDSIRFLSSNRQNFSERFYNKSSGLSILVMCASPPHPRDWRFNLLWEPPGLFLEAICQTAALITALWKHWNKTSSLHFIPLSCWLPHISLLSNLQREFVVSCSCLSLRCRDSLTESQSNCGKHQSASAIFVLLLWSLVCFCWSSQTSVHLQGIT